MRKKLPSKSSIYIQSVLLLFLLMGLSRNHVSAQCETGGINSINVTQVDGTSCDYTVTINVQRTSRFFSAVASVVVDGKEFFGGCFGPACSTIKINVKGVTCGALAVSNLQIRRFAFNTTCNYSSNASLPIELLYFRGEAIGKVNMLEWATASEENNAVQIVERSANGKNDWTEVGRVTPAGNSVEEQRYSLADEAPLPRAYYRLHSIDLDGYEQFSDIITIEREEKKFGIVKLYPVPTLDVVTVDYELIRRGLVRAVLTDLLGRVVSDQQFEGDKGAGQLTLDLVDKAPGMYFLTLDDGQNRTTRRVMKRGR